MFDYEKRATALTRAGLAPVAKTQRYRNSQQLPPVPHARLPTQPRPQGGGLHWIQAPR